MTGQPRYRLGLEFDDQYCVAMVGSTDALPTNSQSAKPPFEPISIGATALRLDDTWLLTDRNQSSALDALARRWKSNQVSKSAVSLLGFCDALRGGEGELEVRRDRVLKYLTILMSAVRNTAIRTLGAVTLEDVCIAVPLHAAFLHPYAKTDKARVVGNLAIKDVPLASTSNDPILRDFELAALAAGFERVTAKWSPDLLAHAMISDSKMPAITKYRNDSYRGLFVVEPFLEGLAIAPYSLSRMVDGTFKVDNDRPAVLIPFDSQACVTERVFNDVLPGNMSKLSNQQKRRFSNRLVLERERFVDSTNGATHVGFNEDTFTNSFATKLMKSVYGDRPDWVPSAADKRATITEDPHNEFLRLFDKAHRSWIDLKSEDPTKQLTSSELKEDGSVIRANTFRLSGTLASHPLLESALRRAISVLLWHPAEVEPMSGSTSIGADKFGDSSLRALNDMDQRCPPRKAVFWDSVTATLTGVRKDEAAVTVDIAKVPARPRVTRILQPWNTKRTGNGHEDQADALCSVSTKRGDKVHIHKIKINLSDRHRDAAVEVELRLDPWDRLEAVVLLDGRPFPATGLDGFKELDEVGRFELYADKDHEMLRKLVQYVNRSEASPWSFYHATDEDG